MAIAVASGRMCYVCFEGECLLDWALSHKASRSTKLAADFTEKWITLLRPDVVITEDTQLKCRKGTNTKELIKAVHRTAENRNLLHTAIRQPRRFKNKYQEAAVYAEAFPDIRQHMPRAPRLWQSEPKEAVYIAAIGLALEIVDSERKSAA